MSDDVKRLADIEAIKQLKARYFRLLDTKQWDDLKALFARDAQFNIGESRHSRERWTTSFVRSVCTSKRR